MHCPPKVGNDFPMSTSTNVGQIAGISMAGFRYSTGFGSLRSAPAKNSADYAKPRNIEDCLDGINVEARALCYFLLRSDGGSSDAPSERCFRQPRKEREMQILFSRFMNDESGATAIEYGLIAAGISIAILTAVQLVGNNLTNVFTNVAANLK